MWQRFIKILDETNCVASHADAGPLYLRCADTKRYIYIYICDDGSQFLYNKSDKSCALCPYWETGIVHIRTQRYTRWVYRKSAGIPSRRTWICYLSVRHDGRAFAHIHTLCLIVRYAQRDGADRNILLRKNEQHIFYDISLFEFRLSLVYRWIGFDCINGLPWKMRKIS